MHIGVARERLFLNFRAMMVFKRVVSLIFIRPSASNGENCCSAFYELLRSRQVEVIATFFLS